MPETSLNMFSHEAGCYISNVAVPRLKAVRFMLSTLATFAVLMSAANARAEELQLVISFPGSCPSPVELHSAIYDAVKLDSESMEVNVVNHPIERRAIYAEFLCNFESAARRDNGLWAISVEFRSTINCLPIGFDPPPVRFLGPKTVATVSAHASDITNRMLEQILRNIDRCNQ